MTSTETEVRERFGGSAVGDEFAELRRVTVTSGSHPFPF
jgi:hypothetical protein